MTPVFARPAGPFSLSRQNKWPAAWQSRVHPAERGGGGCAWLQHVFWPLKGRGPPGPPPRTTTRTLLGLPPPAGFGGAPGSGGSSSHLGFLNGPLHPLTGDRMGLWHGPALGYSSPSPPALQQCPIHLAAPPTSFSRFPDFTGGNSQLLVLSDTADCLLADDFCCCYTCCIRI